MQAHLLRCLAQKSQELGIDPERLCQGLGFNVADLSDPSCRLSLRQAGTMIRRMLECAPHCAVGLELAMSETIASIGMVGYAMLTGPTLKDALVACAAFQAHTGALMHFDVMSGMRTMSIGAANIFFARELEAFLVEEAFGKFLNIGRALSGAAFRPEAVHVVYPRPDYAEHYERVFQCPILFGQPRNVFAFDAAWGRQPIATHDPLTHRQVIESLRQASRDGCRSSEFLESIERILRRDLRRAPSLDEVAVQLCMSERTLRRRLVDERVSYRVVLDTVRKTHAFMLLDDSRVSVETVAREVGFSDARSFRRAFKRWTGRGPRERGEPGSGWVGTGDAAAGDR
ncbi:AraC family transcriptional regulator [Burkholderia pseudomultivorans]|uniref:AraC family transcriptional regulator n=1 Tax=Burkholderia pseudomultivorans TaxID=1207504 RepID=UPI001FC84B97|nr:AraC family transcriptional regulator [Burkholderia pseudomultivorans]